MKNPEAGFIFHIVATRVNTWQSFLRELYGRPREHAPTFSEGVVIGGRLFVAEHLAADRIASGRRRNSNPKPLSYIADWGAEIATLRGLRQGTHGMKDMPKNNPMFFTK